MKRASWVEVPVFIPVRGTGLTDEEVAMLAGVEGPMESIPTAYVRGATPEPPVGCTRTRQLGDVLVFYFENIPERDEAVRVWVARGLDALGGEVFDVPPDPKGTNKY